jgi:hypothetical protein
LKIYNDIINNNRIPSKAKNDLYGLYQNSFCDYFKEQLPFCTYLISNQDEFTLKYGKPNAVDNNKNYIDNGLIGLYS